MRAKLTLRLESALIARAKAYGRAHGKSVSQLVADYFAFLATAEHRAQRAGDSTPLTDSLTGVLEGTGVDEEDYRRHQWQKHLGGSD